MHSPASNRIKTAILRSSNGLIRQSSTRKGITWPMWTRNYAGECGDGYPRFPKELFHPSFSMGFRVETSPADPINVLRAKYTEPRRLVLWKRIRAFHSFPIRHIKFCEEILAETARQQSEFSLKIGRPFRARNDADRLGYVGFDLPSLDLQVLNAILDAQFDHIRAELRLDRTHHNSLNMPFQTNNATRQPWLVARKFIPSVRVCRVPKDQVETRFEEIKRKFPSGAGKVKGNRTQSWTAGKNIILSRPTLRHPIHRLPFSEVAFWKSGAARWSSK